MLTEAAGLAALAGLSPTALIAAAAFLGAPNARRIVLVYLVGAVVMTVVIAVIVYVVLQGSHVYKPRQHATRYGLRLGLGLLLLIVLPFLRRRWSRAGESDEAGQKSAGKKGQGLLGRMIASPRPLAAFMVGVLVYAPPVAFIAAVQVVASTKESAAAAAGEILVLIAITLAFIWMPFVLHLLAPDQTRRFLLALNRWMHRHGRTLALSGLVVGGVVLTVNGILGLTGVVG